MELIDVSATIERGAVVSPSAKIWSRVHVRSGASIGEGCVIGSGVYVGPGVLIGDRCKIQNAALIFDPARISDGVFIGPGAILTNDQYPRAVTPDGQLKGISDWTPVGVNVGTGASIGAGAICIAPLSIGEWSMVGAGSVVVRDVPAHALVVGNPARQVGWVGRSGRKLQVSPGGTAWMCPDTGEVYHFLEGLGLSRDCASG